MSNDFRPLEHNEFILLGVSNDDPSPFTTLKVKGTHFEPCPTNFLRPYVGKVIRIEVVGEFITCAVLPHTLPPYPYKDKRKALLDAGDRRDWDECNRIEGVPQDKADVFRNPPENEVDE